MIRALGYSHTEFDPTEPGRLCRGRERWIEPYEISPSETSIHRLVISGATFEDDSAREAPRGLPHSGIDLAQLIASLFPRKTLFAFMEDGHPADIPEEAEHIELYTSYRSGGLSESLQVRWVRSVTGIRDIRLVLGDDVSLDRVRGFALVDSIELEEFSEQIFPLIGMACLDSPPSRFQPAALPDILEFCRAVVLIHRDKHGPAVGIYSREPIKTDGRLDALTAKQGSLLVRFAIPPMLARWDRALAELRTEWESTREEPFPVPRAPEPSRWEPRRRGRRGRRRRDRDSADTPAPPQAEEGAEAPRVEASSPTPEVTVSPATEANVPLSPELIVSFDDE
jgi:hypothetical protein